MSTQSSPSSASREPQSRRSEPPARQINGLEPTGEHGTSRRSFLVGAGVGALGAGLLADVSLASAHAGRGLTNGDEAILRFLSAAEILETDFWQQYNELGGIQDSEVPGGTGNQEYTAALSVLDADMAQYVHDNTEDEFTHFTFINAYLKSRGGRAVDLERFRTLPSSTATGAQQIKRLTNLRELTVDTSWWTRYRSRTKNPDFGDTFPPAVPGLLKGRFPAIPRSDADLTSRATTRRSRRAATAGAATPAPCTAMATGSPSRSP